MKKFSLLILFVLLISCTEAPKDKIEKELFRANQENRISVYFYPTKRQLNEEYNKRYGGNETEREGFAVWANPGKMPYWCEIHVLEPIWIDDENTLTMGHELAHCIYGSYHKE